MRCLKLQEAGGFASKAIQRENIYCIRIIKELLSEMWRYFNCTFNLIVIYDLRKTVAVYLWYKITFFVRDIRTFMHGL